MFHLLAAVAGHLRASVDHRARVKKNKHSRIQEYLNRRGAVRKQQKSGRPGDHLQSRAVTQESTATRRIPTPSVSSGQTLPHADRKSTRLNSSHLGISYA